MRRDKKCLKYENVTYIFEREVVESDFKVNDRVVLLKHSPDLGANRIFHLIVTNVETKQRRVLLEGAQHFRHW